MGLSASQARLLLLTAKNDGLELQAQLISNERLLLSQEQELIADEYSDATSNMIYEATTESVDARKDNGTMGTTKKGLSLETLAQSQISTSGTTSTVETTDTGYKTTEDITIGGKEYKKDTFISDSDFEALKAANAEGFDESKFQTATKKTTSQDASEGGPGNKVAVTYGDLTFVAQSSFDPTATKDSDAYDTHFYVVIDGQEVEIDESDPTYGSALCALNDTSPYGFVQRGLRNGSVSIYIEDKENKDASTSSDTLIAGTSYVRKSAESLASTSSRYYTEDDAAAQAKYNGDMNRVNAMDKKLENKLNQIETQKKAVETEMESAEQLIKTNVERTFKYFG